MCKPSEQTHTHSGTRACKSSFAWNRSRRDGPNDIYYANQRFLSGWVLGGGKGLQRDKIIKISTQPIKCVATGTYYIMLKNIRVHNIILAALQRGMYIIIDFREDGVYYSRSRQYVKIIY